MRVNKAPLRQLRGTPKAPPVSIVAPVGGWNTVTALADMPAQDAAQLDNWYPELGKVRLRKGNASHATGVGAGAVDTIKEFNVGATRKLLAASSSTIYDASSVGAASLIQAGFSNGRWQVADFIANQLWVNGQDAAQVYNGSSFTASTITGPTVTALKIAHAHRHRMYTAETNSQSFWYGATNAIGGAFSEFPLGRVAQLGGNLISIATWTVDTGEGPDDLAAFIMSSGQVVVYNGSDPGDAANWALVGIFNLGAPLGPRAFAKVGADLRIITMQDYISATAALQSGAEGVPPTKMQAAVIEATSAAPTAFGWQGIVYPRGGFVLFNLPLASGTYQQHVQNLTTQAWCRYTGIKSHVWGLYNDNLYFGGDGGIVYQAETGNDDNGASIQADAKQAWTDLGTPGRKRIAAIRPILGVTGTANYTFGIGFDFRDAIVGDPAIIDSGGAEWEVATWDVDSWSPENLIGTGWRIASGTGTHISPRLRVTAKTEVNWYRTDYRVEPGNAL